MARYTGPRVRISRRFGVPIFGPSKYLERRNYGPGVHGPKSRRRHTDYGLGVIEIKHSNAARQLAAKNLEVAGSRAVPDWLSLDKEALKGVLMRIPTRAEIQPIANEQAVVEFYSR